MKKIILFIVLSFCSLIAGNGGYGGAFLRVGMGPTGQALGNSGVARFNPVPSSVYYNPAIITELNSSIFEAGYNFMSLDRQFIYLAYATKLKGTASLSVNYIKSGVGNILSRDDEGVSYGTIEHDYHAVQVIFGKSFGDFSFGFALRLMYEFMDNQEFEYSGSGVAMDIGFLYKLSDQLWFGAHAKDINGKLESNSEGIFSQGQTLPNDFPTIYKLGVGWQVDPDIGSVYYDYEQSSKETVKHHIGLESTVLMEMLQVRAGMENDRFTAGFGLTFEAFGKNSEINYVYLPSVIDEGDSHAFSWIFTF